MTRRVVDDRGPVDDRRGMPPMLVENREPVVLAELDVLSPAVSGLLGGAVDDDPIEPRSEGGLAAERIDTADRATQRILDDFLCVLGVGPDADGQTVSPSLVCHDETFRGARVAAPQGFDELTIAVVSADRHHTHALSCLSRFPAARSRSTRHRPPFSAAIQRRTYSGQLMISVPSISAPARNRTASRSTSVMSFRSRTMRLSDTVASSSCNRCACSTSSTPLRTKTLAPSRVDWLIL